jgi:hypothetical protein
MRLSRTADLRRDIGTRRFDLFCASTAIVCAWNNEVKARIPYSDVTRFGRRMLPGGGEHIVIGSWMELPLRLTLSMTFLFAIGFLPCFDE